MSEIISAQHLNFYSKYNRVRDKQNIESLYFLIDNTQEYIQHLENMTLVLNMSRDEQKSESSKPKDKNIKYNTKNINVLESFDRDQQEQEEEKKRFELAQKLKKLEKLQKQFYDQLDRSEKNYKIKKQMRDQQRRQRQKYRKQLINVIEQQSQASQPSRSSKLSQDPKYSQNQKKDEQMNEINDFQDYYKDAPDFQIQDFSHNNSRVPIKQPKKKFKQIIQLQKQQKYVYSVDEQQEGKSSIVIERLKIQSNKKQSQGKSYQENSQNKDNAVQDNLKQKQHGKQHKNYYEIELTHSQSQTYIRKFQQPKSKQQYQQIQQIKQSPVIHIEKDMQQLPMSPYTKLDQPSDIIAQFNQNIDQENNNSDYQKGGNKIILEEKLLQSQNQNDRDISSTDNTYSTNKKSSFKKLMAANRSNLVPRLAISTILNEHINQHHGELKSNNIVQSNNMLPSLQQIKQEPIVHLDKDIEQPSFIYNQSRNENYQDNPSGQQNKVIINEIVETPISHLQNFNNNNMFYNQDPSDIIQEIDDKVSIDQFPDYQQAIKKKKSNSKASASANSDDASPIIFRSQAQNRKTFDNQQEVKSITESLDFHPLENPNLENNRKADVQQDNPFLNLFKLIKKEDANQAQTSALVNKKSSFKKLMAANRSNLVPRLAISTILNEHINQALGDSKNNNLLSFLVPGQNQQALKDNALKPIKEIEAVPPKKASKKNFKDAMIQKKKLNSSREVVFNNQDPSKSEKYKKLFQNFFDSN